MALEFKYETYQDVKANLFKYSVVPLLGFAILFLFVLLPELTRTAMFALVEKLVGDWKSLGKL